MSKKCRDLEIHIHTHQYIEALRDALYKYTTTTTTTTYIHTQADRTDYTTLRRS